MTIGILIHKENTLQSSLCKGTVGGVEGGGQYTLVVADDCFSLLTRLY